MALSVMENLEGSFVRFVTVLLALLLPGCKVLSGQYPLRPQPSVQASLPAQPSDDPDNPFPPPDWPSPEFSMPPF